MFIGQLKVSRNGRSYTYHRLLESVRTAKGPRQRLVLSLGTLDLPKSEWPRLAERIEDLLNHQERVPFGTSTWTNWRRRSPNASAASSSASKLSGTDTGLRRRSIPSTQQQ